MLFQKHVNQTRVNRELPVHFFRKVLAFEHNFGNICSVFKVATGVNNTAKYSIIVVSKEFIRVWESQTSWYCTIGPCYDGGYVLDLPANKGNPWIDQTNIFMVCYSHYLQALYELQKAQMNSNKKYAHHTVILSISGWEEERVSTFTGCARCCVIPTSTHYKPISVAEKKWKIF